MLPVIIGFGAGYVFARTSDWTASLPSPSIRGVTPTFGELTVKESEVLMQGGLIGLNMYQLEQGIPGISRPLHEGKIKYNRRDPNEHFMSIKEIHQYGYGDCEDLACAVAAERTFRGFPSKMVLYQVRPGLFHAVVQDEQTGKLIDPSRTGGMGSP